MKWQGRRQSTNISNKGGRGAAAIGGGGLIMALLIFLITGDPFAALNVGTSGTGQQQSITFTEEEQKLYDYAGVVLADTEDAWNALLPKYGEQYRNPKMHIYRGQVQTGCGIGQSGMGPFYCPADESVYMDLEFYDTLVNRFGAKDGDFILSYVISHEVGHHVQTVLGVTEQFHAQRGKISDAAFNDLSVRFELQADYLAGVVARYQDDKGYLEDGDIEEAISAAWSIGDDKIQKQQQGYVTPESYTHGTSEQRMRWYQKGYQAGDLSGWDTFKVNDL